MNVPIAQIICRKCNAELGENDKFCRQCGTRSDSKAGWWESPWLILPLLFVVLGPFALPLLWGSRRFSRTWKIVLTIIAVAVPIYAVWQVSRMVDQALAPIIDLGK